MSQVDTFRPSTGPLLVRGNLSHGLPKADDVFKSGSLPAFRQTKRRPESRPGTVGSSCGGGRDDGGYRFGRLSHNSFFARHNPHPARVRHIKGLLDVPICSVADDGYVSNPRYSLNFPPNNFNKNKVQSYSKYYNIPVNAINVNSQMYPIDTITGLQYFMGKPLNMRIFRDKNSPGNGIVPASEVWRDELQALTAAVGLSPADRKEKQQQLEQARIHEIKQQTLQRQDGKGGKSGTGTGRQRTSQYSQTTGRLLPPASRALSRGATARPMSIAERAFQQQQQAEQDPENVMLVMLGQILQTDDIGAVQSWLVSANDNEKSKMLDMLKAVVASNEEYYKQNNAEYVTSKPWQEARTPPSPNVPHDPLDQPDQNDNSDALRHVERLSIAEDRTGNERNVQGDVIDRYTYTPQARPASQMMNANDSQDYGKPPGTSNVFRPSKSRGGQADQAKSGVKRPKTPSRGASPADLGTEVKLRYTMTPIKDQDISSQKQSLSDILQKDTDQNETEPTWQQSKSTI